MKRFLLPVLAACLGFATAAQAGGPPPMYVVVDRVVLESDGIAPDRIMIAGSFIRQEGSEGKFGKPVVGSIHLSLGKTDQAEARAEWEKWRQAAGSGKVVAVGSCHDAGSLLRIAIRKADERPTRPDAVYTPGVLERFGQLYATGHLEQQAPVRNLTAFVKERQAARAAR